MSCGVISEIAVPVRPARPVRPVRCTYDSASCGKSWLITWVRCEMSIPRAATSVATRKRRRPSRVADITRSRSFWGRSPLSHAASKPWRWRAPATRSVSSFVLQKTTALSGSSTSIIRSSAPILSAATM